MGLKIKVLQAMHGDSILIQWEEAGKGKNILIDGGIGRTYYQVLKKELQQIKDKGEHVDLLVITHIDEDHIEGVCKIFEDDKFDKSIIKRVWFNSGRVIASYFDKEIDKSCEIAIDDISTKKKSVKQGNTLENKLKKLDIENKEPIMKKKLDEVGEVKIRVLSPDIEGLKKLNTKWVVEIDKDKKKASKIADYKYSVDELLKNKEEEDKSVPNESSIAFLLEYRGEKCLFLGDAKAKTVEIALREEGYSEENKVNINLMKIAHHGSKKNTTKNLLNIIDCSDFIISTNSDKYQLPDKECLAKIISLKSDVKFYFNYDYVEKKRIFSRVDKEKYKFECITLDKEKSVELKGGIFLWR
ncbi:MAG: ComEC/Rec2 family competence protein [Sarcina sp.]